MAQFIVCHARKIKTATGLLQVARHNLREKVDYKTPPSWISRPQLVVLNKSIGAETSEEVIKLRQKLIEQADLKRKPQKNAAAAVEFNLTASYDWFVEKHKNQIHGFLGDCIDFISEKYGQVLSSTIHLDEKTPHAHVLCVPIVGDRYTSSEFLGGKNGLRDLQQEIYEKVGKKWGLERGVEGSEARHNGVKEYENQVSKEIAFERKHGVALQDAKYAVKKLNELKNMTHNDLKTETIKMNVGGYKTWGELWEVDRKRQEREALDKKLEEQKEIERQKEKEVQEKKLARERERLEQERQRQQQNRNRGGLSL